MRQLSYETNFDFVPLGHDRISHWKTMFGLAHPTDPRLYLGSHFHPDCPMNILLFIHIHPYSSIFIHIHPLMSCYIIYVYIPSLLVGFLLYPRLRTPAKSPPSEICCPLRWPWSPDPRPAKRGRAFHAVPKMHRKQW